MALWTNVYSGFDADEETVNFGARAFAETNGSIYESFTMATIQADREIVDAPNVLASIQYSKVCVAIDKSITIFSNETCKEITISSGFDSLVTSYCLSEDGFFLFISLATGMVHCLHLHSEGKLVFSKDIFETDNQNNKIVNMFTENNERLDIVITTSSGEMYRVSGFHDKVVHNHLIQGNEESVNEVVKSVECSKIFAGLAGNKVSYVSVNNLNCDTSVLMIGTNAFMWPSECSSLLKALPYKYIKAQFLKNERVLLCLRSDKSLSIVCPWTLLARKVYDGPVNDFLILQDHINDFLHLVIVREPLNGADTTFLEYVSYPDFQTKFQISVPTWTYLVECIGCSTESIYYLEGIKGSTENIESIRVKALVESLPELRLERLLRRERFEEAEVFANKYNLNKECIFCAKAALFVNRSGPWARGNSTEFVDLDEFIATLDNINDMKFVCDCCNNALMPSYNQMKRLLLYARQRIVRCIQESSDDKQLSILLSAISSTLHRLETFEIIRKINASTNRSEEEEVSDWIQFSKADLLNECIKHLTHGEMEAAALVWVQHFLNIARNLSEKKVSELLEAIPEKTPTSLLWPWLKHFVPSLLSVQPNSLSQIISWSCRKTSQLEKLHRSSWPHVGLDFVNGFIELLNVEESHECSSLYQQYAEKNSPLQRLLSLVQTLTDLIRLKESHRIMVSLDTYMSDPTEMIHLLLNKVHMEEMNCFVEKFLHQYMMNHGLKNDHVFSLYIQKTLRNSKSWWFWEEAPWEKRVAIVVGFIHNIQNRLQLILEVLKAASVPWSPTMNSLAEQSYAYDHALVSKIRTEKNSIPVKLILKKYGFEHVGINNRLIGCIIKKGDANMVNDILELTKTDRSMRAAGLASAINKCLNKGDISRAMDMINSLEDDIAEHCCKQIVNYVMGSLKLKSVNKSLEYFIEIFNVVENKLREILKREKHESINFDETLLNIPHLKALYDLKTKFNINITLLQYHTQKQKILQDYITSVTKDVHAQDAISDSIPLICKNAGKVADLLKAHKLLVESILCERTEMLSILNHVISETAEKMSELEEHDASYVQRICLTSMLNKQNTLAIADDINKLCISSISTCHSTELQGSLALYTWVKTYIEVCCVKINDIDSTYDPMTMSQWKLYMIYTDTVVSSRLNLLKLFQDSLKIYLLCRGIETATGDIICSQNFNKSSQEDEIRKLLVPWMENVHVIRVEQLDYSALQIIKTLYFSCCYALTANQNSEIKNVMFQYLLSLLQKVISTRSFDLQLGLVCLFMLPESKSFNWFPSELKSCSFQADYNRHRLTSQLGWEYFHLLKNEMQDEYNRYKTLHYWAKKLSNYGISYKEMFNSYIESRREILQRIMSSRNEFSMKLIEEFCEDFQFNLNDCLILYLEVLLKKWNPTLNVVTINGIKELKIDMNEVKKLETTCKNIVSRLEDKNCLEIHITSIETQINFYYYEVFLIIMDLLGDRNANRINHFYFLQNYTRVGKPTEIEQEQWAQLNPEHSALPPISEWRLPFIPSVNQWKIITPELNLKTYEKWLEIAPILELQSDLICTLAVKGAVAQTWSSHKSESNSEWSLYPKHSALLKEIKKCIKLMSGDKALEYGTAALYYVANHTPPGADQVAAAQECYSYAQLWEMNSSIRIEDDSTTQWSGNEMVEKIKFKYHRFTSKHILYTHGLGQERYLSLTLYPEKLIREIYMDESIPLRYRAASPNRPNINSAADCLGKLFNLNMVKLRADLLLEWLQPEMKQEMRLNDSNTEVFSTRLANGDVNSTAVENLLRASYILDHGDSEQSANFLINIAFNEQTDEFGPGVRYRALQVLQTITDTDALQNLTKRNIKNIKQHMKSLQYLSELENLGLRYSVASFEKCSKHELAQMLLTTQFHSPLVLSLILRICLDFNVQDYHLWNTTLNQMAKLSMVTELENFLPTVATLSHVINCTGYISGWQAIISETFRKIDINPSAKQIEDCIRTLRLLHTCPVVNKLNFNDIIRYCFDSNQAQFAVILLPFLNDDQKNNVLKVIKTSFDVPQLISKLEMLSTKGVLAVSYSVQVLREIAKSKEDNAIIL